MIKNAADEVLGGEKATLTEGEIFSISLVADERLLQPPVQQRHVYALSLDQYGKSELMYPDIDHGVVDSPIPFILDSGKIAQEIPLGRVRSVVPIQSRADAEIPVFLAPIFSGSKAQQAFTLELLRLS